MHALLISVLLVAPPLPPPSPARTALDEGTWISTRAALIAASRGDPPIAEVQVAAARAADPLASDAPLASRARAAALLPKLTAELRFDDRSYRVVGTQTAGEVDYARYAPGWTIAVGATWELGALVLPPAERIDGAGALARARRRDEAVQRATAHYFDRRRLRLSLALDPPANPLDRAAAELEIARLGAELDALTGGLFRGNEWRGSER